MELDQNRKDVVKKLKEKTDIGDDYTAILRLVEYDWDLEKAIENKQTEFIVEDVSLSLRRRPLNGEQENGEAEPLLNARSTDVLESSDEQTGVGEMKVDGDQRLSFSPKYNWDCVDTRKWKNFARKQLTERCEAITYDYQKFSKMQFAQVEEMIAVNIFGIDTKIAIQALKTNNILCSYDAEQRKRVMEVRMAIEEVAGEDILIQVIPILIRRDEDIKAQKPDSFVVSVFRVKSSDQSSPDSFVDWNANIHKSWESVLDTCPGLPQGMMAYPKNGFLREEGSPLSSLSRINQEVQPALRVCSIGFGETPKSGLLERNLYIIRVGIVVITTVSGLAMIWNPLGWTGIALGVARGGFFLATSVMVAIVDPRDNDGESITLSLPAFIKNIGNILIKDGIHHYLRKVARQHRGLTALERIIITAFGDGFNEEQIYSFIGCVYSIVMEMRNCTIREIPVMKLVTCSQQLFSCLLSPKKAERMLEDVRAELALEEFEAICLLQEKMEQLVLEKEDLEALDVPDEQLEAKSREIQQYELELTESRMKFQAMKSRQLEQGFLRMKRLSELEEEVKILEAEIAGSNFLESLTKQKKLRLKKKEMETIQTEITTLQLEHLQQFMEEEMSDCSAKDAFKKQVIKRSAQRKCIKENNRIIQTIFEMDAEVLFKYAADTQSTITFPTGEHVRINDQFDLSTRTLSNLNGSSEAETEEFLKVMKCTAEFQEGRLTEDELINAINESMLKHDIITRSETTEFMNWLNRYIPEEENSFVATLSSQQCRHLKNSLSAVSEEDQKLTLKAALFLTKNLKLSLSNKLTDCVEIIIKSVTTKLDGFMKRVSDLESTNRRDEIHNAALILDLPDEDIILLRSENYPAAKVFSCLLGRLAEPGRLADQLIDKCKERLEELLRTGILPTETLLFVDRQNTSGVSATTSSPQSVAAANTATDLQTNSNEDFVAFYVNP